MRPGLLTTVQDLGRWGYQSMGVPVAGAMDPFSHRLANLFVGNDAAAATLEITIAGPELLFSEERTIAVTGAAFDLTINGRAVASAGRLMVPTGGVLRFASRRAGARAYLAVSGGFDVPKVLGSRSTYLRAGLGGHGGRALAAGDQLLLGKPVRADGRPRAADDYSGWSVSTGPAVIRIVAGPDDDRFAPDALNMLQSGIYQVMPQSDRMALRLAGPTIRATARHELISDATPAGTLQVPPSGLPMLLMADRQTTGGYPRIATVISADLPTAAQAAPGEPLTFAICSQEEALAALIAQEQTLLAYEAA